MSVDRQVIATFDKFEVYRNGWCLIRAHRDEQGDILLDLFPRRHSQIENLVDLVRWAENPPEKGLEVGWADKWTGEGLPTREAFAPDSFWL